MLILVDAVQWEVRPLALTAQPLMDVMVWPERGERRVARSRKSRMRAVLEVGGTNMVSYSEGCERAGGVSCAGGERVECQCVTCRA